MLVRMIVRENGMTSRIHVVQGRIAPSEQGRGRSGEQAAGMHAVAGIGSLAVDLIHRDSRENIGPGVPGI